MHGVGVPASYSRSYLLPRHGLDNPAEMVAAPRCRNVVEVIGTEVGLSVHESAMVRLPDQRFATWLPTFSRHCLFLLVSIGSKRQMCHSSPGHTYIFLAFDASSRYPTASRSIPSLHNTLVQRPPGFQPSLCVRRVRPLLYVMTKSTHARPELGHPHHNLACG
jgi:hypothetical protein